MQCPSQGLGPNKELAQNWKPLEMSEEEYEEVRDHLRTGSHIHA